MRLRTRIIIAVVIASSVINLFLCFYFTEKIKKSELKNLSARIEKSAYMMKLVNARPLYNVDKETLRVNMETFLYGLTPTFPHSVMTTTSNILYRPSIDYPNKII